METPLAEQSPDTIYAKEEQILAFVQAAYPTLDLSPGTALRDLVIKLYAHLETRVQEQIDLALVSSSLLEISKDPNAVDETQVERVLSNFNVSRGAGSTASGTLRLFFSSNASVVISTGTVFTLNGVTFTPAAPYVLVSSDNYTGTSTQRIFEESGSLYTVVISITAAASGSAANLRANTVMTGITPTIPNLVSGKADADFTGGADSDDNVTMLAKAKAGIVGKVFGGRDHIKAKLKEAFSQIMDVGCVGFLDPEMNRDLVDGVHIGSRIDVYAKTASYPSRLQEKLAAQMISYNPFDQEAVFQIKLPASKAAGMYTVESIRSLVSQAGTFDITSDVRLMSGNTLHYVADNASPAFTAYQTATIRFLVPYENLKEAATATGLGVINSSVNPWLPNEYVETSSVVPPGSGTPSGPSSIFLNTTLGPFFYFYVEYLKMPNILEVQSYVDSAAERSLSADILVKAPVPVMCSLQMRLMKPSGAEDPDMDALKAALVSKFNSFEMGQNIPASALIHTAYQNIPAGYTVDLPVHMYGVVINPNMTKDVLYSSDALRAPKLYTRGVTGNTCAFFLESNLIDISVVECT
jgi:hypothetical protein